ncbi:MAG: adenine deaminase [Acutalibacteraceae bacterium]
MDRKEFIQTALGEVPFDLVLKNGQIVNVFTGQILKGDVAVKDGIIVGVGKYSGTNEIDINGKYILPGFVNAHVHVESSMVTPPAYAREELKWGTTTLITDPHEIANVGGLKGIETMLAMAEHSHVNYYVMLPSCVPSTPFEHAGAVLHAEDLKRLKSNKKVLGLGEMMNVVGVLNGDKEILDKLDTFGDCIVDGHAPQFSGKQLQAYRIAGIDTDHESVSYEEALEKLQCGMAVLVREGSASKNLEAIIQGIVKDNIDTAYMAFCTDDKHLADVQAEGTIRFCVKKAVALGLSPIKAIQMASINAARIYGLKNIGAVAVGYKADMVVVEDLKDFEVLSVYKDGQNIAELPPIENLKFPIDMINTVHLAPFDENVFEVPKAESYTVIQIVENQIVTDRRQMTDTEIRTGLADGTIRKIAVMERHKATGQYACAYISGYGLKHGAVATTVAHDSHNLIVIGDNNRDMLTAAKEIERIQGGYVIAADGHVKRALPLRFGGLMSLKPTEQFIPALNNIIQTAYAMGVNPQIDPFITLSFMALPVIPSVRITDMGLFDVDKFEFIK